MEFKNSNQLKSFMKKEANRLNISPQSFLRTFYAKELLNRVSDIDKNMIVVKGSFSQYMHLGKITRPILDIDLSSSGSHTLPINLIFSAIYDNNKSLLEYDILSIPYQTKNGIYKISTVAKVGFTDEKKIINIPVRLDFKEYNDVILEPQLKKVPPLFEGDKDYDFYTPSFEEHLAEKLYIISHNKKTNVLNTRVKDFYDVYQLHGDNYDFDKFSLYYMCMLKLYHEDEDGLKTNFLNSEYINKHIQLWKKMIDKYDFAEKDLSFEQVVYYTRAVLSEQIQKYKSGKYSEEIEGFLKIRQRKREINL